METKYYVDPNGNYLGGFLGAPALALVPDGSILVPTAPDCAWWTWDFVNDVWIQNPPPV
jgi:hypothetical protein